MDIDLGVVLVIGVVLLSVARRIWLRKLPPREPGGMTIGPVYLPPHIACQGLVIYGQPGAGKSFFLLSKIREFARNRIPMVITTVRASDYAEIEKIFREEGCLDNLRRSSPGSEHRLNIGQFFTKTLPGGSPRVLAHVLSMAAEVMNDTAGGRKQDEFWQGFYHEMVLMGTRLLIMAKGYANLDDLFEIIMSAPSSPEEADSDKFYAKNFCGRMLRKAGEDHAETRDYNQVVSFFVDKMAGVGTKAKSAVQQMATNCLSGLISDEFHEALCTTTTITPEKVEQEKLTWVLDYPLMVWHSSGRLYQFLHICAVDLWCLARDPNTVDRMFVKIRDEAGWVCNSSHDVRIQAVSRAQKLASIIAVQNTPLLSAQLGGGENGKQQAMALAGVHNTRMFFKNACPETGKYASECIGKSKQILTSDKGGGGKPSLLGLGNIGWSESYQPILRPEYFSHLEVGTLILHSQGEHRFIDLRKRGK